MIKKLLFLLLAVAAIYGAALSPFNIRTALETKATLEQTLKDKQNASQQKTQAQMTFSNAVSAFDSERQFEIHYTDVYRLRQLLDGIQGMEFVSLHQADPAANWAKGMEINVDDFAPISETEGNPNATLPTAVCMTLMVEDIAQGLKVVDRMSLPICQIITSSPGTIEVTFLTGGVS